MAINYFFCDGNTKTTTSISMVQTSRPNTQYSDGNGTIYTRTNARLTFTASVTPLTNLRIYYTYETRNKIVPNAWNPWFEVTAWALMLAGQNVVVADVVLTESACWSDGSEQSPGGEW